MDKKANGSKHNGAKGDREADKIVRFPVLAERGRLRSENMKKERDSKGFRSVKAHPAFFNVSKIPPFTRLITALFLAVQLGISLLLNPQQKLQAVYFLGFVPAYFTNPAEMPWHAPAGLITHIFIHGSWTHLIFNCVMALSLGMFFERMFGSRLCALFFFVCGIAGALAYFAFNPFSTAPVVGASGSLSGLFGAAVVLLHRQGHAGNLGRYGVWPLALFWVGFMALTGMLSGGNLAWQAHIGGLLAGITLFFLTEKRGRRGRP